MRTKFFRRFLPLSLLLLIIGLTSCTPKYHFKIDAISSGQLGSNQTFFIVSGNPDMKGGDLRFREAARYVATALEGKGYRQTQQVGNADLLVELTFYTDEPREVLDVRHYPETYYRPGFAYSIQVPVYNSAGVVIGYRSRIMREPSRSYTHWQEQLESVTVYDKVMEISAYDNRPNAPTKDLEEMWSIVITNSDTSQDIRSYLPYMVAAAIPYIGEDTGSQIVVSITPDDPTATFIRNPGALE